MKSISLVSLHLENFRSFMTPTTLSFSQGAGLKLITGNNEAEPRLGANGCGKSTIWDAVTFALYGTSVKGLRPSDLISNGQPKVVVSVDLKVNGTEYTVQRTAPPMRIYLDGQPVEQPAIDNLLGLSRTRFLNSVVFGQSMPLFIDLPVPQRGDILDEVLDLEMWMRAANTATEKHREASNTLVELRRAMARTTGRIEGLGDLSRFTAQQYDWQQRQRERIEEIITAMTQLERQNVELEVEITDPTLEATDEGAAKQKVDFFTARHTKARERTAALTAEIEVYHKQIQFLEDNDNCPTCDQPITTEHVMEHN